MSSLSAVIFLGFPLAGMVFAIVLAIATLARWTAAKKPESHYIASRVKIVADSEADKAWIEELESLALPYRHTVC